MFSLILYVLCYSIMSIRIMHISRYDKIVCLSCRSCFYDIMPCLLLKTLNLPILCCYIVTSVVENASWAKFDEIEISMKNEQNIVIQSSKESNDIDWEAKRDKRIKNWSTRTKRFWIREVVQKGRDFENLALNRSVSNSLTLFSYISYLRFD